MSMGDLGLISLSPDQHAYVQKLSRSLWRWHIGITLAILGVGIGAAVFPDFGRQIAPTLGPQTHHVGLIVALVLTWVLVTVVLLRTQRPMTTDGLVLFLSTAAFSLLLLIFLRERTSFGDFGDFTNAGRAILAGESFPPRYHYPPLWAYLIAGIQWLLGDRASDIFCFVVTHLSTVGFLPLAVVCLTRCGIPVQRSTFLVLAATAINVATVRNMAYVQTNYLVLDLLLIGVLAPAGRWWLAAIALAVGAHIKLLPLIVLPLLVLERRWHVATGFVVVGLILFVATSLPHGLTYWASSLENLSSWDESPFRAASLTGFLENTADVFGWAADGRAIAGPLQAALAAFVGWLTWRAARNRTFTAPGAAPDGVLDGLVPLLFLWLVLSPTVWVYHLVVLIVPALMLTPHLTTTSRQAAFMAGWFLVFCFPTVDVYPVSYLRLVGWLGLLVLTAIVIRERGLVASPGLR
jgi:hypothetical protein